MSLELHKKFLKKYGFRCELSENFKKSMTHPSFTRENNFDRSESYERLEFLGDSILKFIVSEFLYLKYKDKQEGELTKIRSYLVSDEFLAKLALEIKLNELIILGTSEEKTDGRNKQSILACSFEAFLGAMYLENQMKELTSFLKQLYEKYLEKEIFDYEKYNPKAILQEYTQSLDANLPKYITVCETKKKDMQIFEVEVQYHQKTLGKGKGASKKEAQQQAARNACEKLNITKEKK